MLEVPLEQVCVSGTGLCVQLEVLSNRSVFLELVSLCTATSFSRTDLCVSGTGLCVQLEVFLELICVSGTGLCAQLEVSLEEVCVS